MSTDLAETTDNDWRLRCTPPAGIDAYPVDGWCYACGFRHIGHDADHLFLPELASAVLGGLVYSTIPAELGLPDTIDHWQPAHIEALRALVAELQQRIHIAEGSIARATANG